MSIHFKSLALDLRIILWLTGSNDQDVSKLNLGPLRLRNLFEVLELYRTALEGFVRDVVLLSPRVVVEQDASSDNALLGHV